MLDRPPPEPTADLHEAGSILTTFSSAGYAPWERATVNLPSTTSLQLASGLVRRGPSYRFVVTRGNSGFSDRYVHLLAGTAAARRGATVLYANCIWECGSRQIDRRLGRAQAVAVDQSPRYGRAISARIFRKAVASGAHFGVLTRGEVERWPQTWGADPSHVHLLPCWAKASEHEVLPAVRQGVFAGGDSMRDFRALLAAAPQIDAPVRIASRLPMPGVLAPNVTAGAVTPAEYEVRAREAAIVVVPLRADTERSSGQHTFLDAMLRGQAVVITDAPGVREYVTHGEHALIVAPNDPDALAAAISRLLDDPHEAQAMGARARALVLDRFTYAHHLARCLHLLAQLADDQRGAAA